ncbi:neck protein [Streptomyces phage VWB]|uniref:Uncharacterized protein n=1 Tax=Streptomyces phage VWB TaxID=10702 RepID=Q6VY48_9CAUD|nr:neck protein [Streptomyces phage VWB]pir/S34247/ hypothetical protein 5 - actinophage VWB [Streptomyces phage VWB]AAR29731.1 hypothetical protein [Streptomyces phage VWB]
MAREGFQLSTTRRNVAAFLRSPGVRQAVEASTREIEAAARQAAEPDAGQFRTDITEESNRVRGAVIGDYATADPEDSRRALLRGLEGGRT